MVEVRLKNKYREDILPRMMEQFSYDNVNQVPRLTKVVLTRGWGKNTII